MDSLDEFEFKPLTEGLGFHKKAEKAPPRAAVTEQMIERVQPQQLNTQAEDDLLGRESTRASSKTISDLIASLPPSLDFMEEKSAESKPVNKSAISESRPQIFQPFARDDFKAGGKTVGAVLTSKLPQPGTKATAAPTATPEASPSLYRDRLNESFARAFPHADRKAEIPAPMKERRKTIVAGLEPIAVNFGSSVIDAMVVTGMSALLLVSIVAITRVNLNALLSNARTDGPTQIHIALLYLACLQLYLLTARSFFGASLGEWAFDLQLGSGADQKRAFYPLQVAWRTILVTFTGLILFPILSLIFRRDVAKYATGLQLYCRKA